MTQSDLTDTRISETLAPYGVSPSAELSERIRIYVATLLQWNAKIALTTVAKTSDILRVHFGESFFAGRVAEIVKGRAADIGTGAGFPSIPIRMVNPELKLTLVEPVTKKTVFIAEVLRKIAIDDVSIMRNRMEELADDALRFDFVISRALGRYERLLSWARSRISSKGKVVLLVTLADAIQLRKASLWQWQEPVKVPESHSRVVLVGDFTGK